MPSGFQDWDGQGRLTTDITDRFSLLLAEGSATIPGLQYNGQGQVITPWTNIVVPGLTAAENHHVNVDGGVDIQLYTGYFAIRQGAFMGSASAQTVYYSVWVR